MTTSTGPALPSSQSIQSILSHRYNDDLLLDEGSRAYAKGEFPLIYHVLDNPDLRAAFEPIDAKAGDAKRRSQRAGSWVVLLAMLSLMGAAAEPLWRNLPSPWAVLLATGTALLGLAAVMFGAFGVLHGKQKDQWLHHRLCTERLRQLHFQAFIWKLPDIAGSCNKGDPSANQHFLEDCRKTVGAFMNRLKGGPMLSLRVC